MTCGWKRWFSLLLLAGMLLPCMVSCKAAEEEKSIPEIDEDDLVWMTEGTYDRKVTILGIEDHDLREFVVPGEVDGDPVIEFQIGSKEELDVRTIVLSDGIRKLGELNGCSRLKEIHIPDSVIWIYEDAFLACPDVVIYAPSGSVAEKWAVDHGIRFKAEGKVKKQEIKDGPLPEVVVLRTEDFYYYTAFIRGKEVKYAEEYFGESVAGAEMPAGINVVARMFYGDEKLERIVITNSKVIENEAFFGCTNLRSVEIRGGVEEIEQAAFCGCTSLQSFVIPEGIERISDSTFYGCVNLTSVIIPASVERIGTDAFYGCDNLVIRTPKGSYAERWARDKGIPVETY